MLAMWITTGWIYSDPPVHFSLTLLNLDLDGPCEISHGFQGRESREQDAPEWVTCTVNSIIICVFSQFYHTKYDFRNSISELDDEELPDLYICVLWVLSGSLWKGWCHETFELWFFIKHLPPRPPIQVLKISSQITANLLRHSPFISLKTPLSHASPVLLTL
jgi:hypothetical protein